MGREIKVGDVMTQKFISVSPKTSILECAKKMNQNRVGTLIIQEGGILKGLLRDSDIIWSIAKNQNLSNLIASDLMLRKIKTITANKNISEAMQKIKKSKMKWLPVISKKRVIGMLTLNDICSIEPSLIEILQNSDVLDIREEKEKEMRKKAAKSGEGWTGEGKCGQCGQYSLLFDSGKDKVCEFCKNN